MAILLLINLEFFIINRKDLKKNLSLELLAGLIALPLYLDIFMSKGLETVDSLAFAQIINAIFIPRFLGWISIIIIVIGIFYSIEEKKYFIIADIIGLLIFIFMFYRLEINVFIPYARALMYLFVIFAVVFGYGCEKIIGFSKNKKIRIIMAIALTALLLFLLLPKKIDSMGPIYHIINEQEYKDFTWIKDNTNKNAIVLIDPWKADAFTPIAERAVYSRIVQGPSEKYAKMNEEIAKFFSNNCTDTSFLENNNITIIYGNCNSSDLEEIHPKVYSLPHPFQSESAS